MSLINLVIGWSHLVDDWINRFVLINFTKFANFIGVLNFPTLSKKHKIVLKVPTPTSVISIPDLLLLIGCL
jgi:hypothetical protein